MISLLAAAAALSLKLVSLPDFALGCRRPVSQACPPSAAAAALSLTFMISLLAADVLFLKLVSLTTSLLAAAAAWSPKLVSLHDFALGCRCRRGSQACLCS